MVLPNGDMSIIVPVFKGINKIMLGESDVLHDFFSQCNDVIMKSLSINLNNRMKMTRREAVRTFHFMISSNASEEFKNQWFLHLVPLLMSRLVSEDC